MAAPQRLRRGGAGITLAVAGLALLAPSALAADTSIDDSVTTLTGLAADTGRQVYWSVDRSTGVVRAISPDGSVAGEVRYGAKPVDVQATAFQGNRVWIGDVGDPDASRKEVSVLRIGDLDYGTTAEHRRYVLTYPDQPQDSGAVAVSPSGRIHLVTRGERPGIYRTGAPVSGGQRNQLQRLADAPQNTTDASFSADGTKLLVRTLTSVHVYETSTFSQVAAAELPQQAQGLAMSPSLEGSGLQVSGQAIPIPLVEVEQPTTLADVPAAPQTPTAASPSPDPEEQAKSSGSRGTRLALVAAAVISLAAAAVVAVKK